MAENDVGLPPVANASGLGPIPDQVEMNMTEKPEEKKEAGVTVVGTSGEVAPKPKRGRPTGNGKKKAQPAAAAPATETRCRVSVRFRLRKADKAFEMRTEGRAKSPQQVQALFLKWAREVEGRWAKL